MEEEDIVPWWRKLMIGAGFALGLLVLSGILMGGIVFVARFLDTAKSAMSAPPAPITAVDMANTATGRTSPYAPEPWPSHPGQGAGFGGGGTRWPKSGGRESTTPLARPTAPTGISVAEYQAAAAAGKAIYLPNPRGQCDLASGESLRALEACLAAQAAR